MLNQHQYTPRPGDHVGQPPTPTGVALWSDGPPHHLLQLQQLGQQQVVDLDYSYYQEPQPALVQHLHPEDPPQQQMDLGYSYCQEPQPSSVQNLQPENPPQQQVDLGYSYCQEPQPASVQNLNPEDPPQQQMDSGYSYCQEPQPASAQNLQPENSPQQQEQGECQPDIEISFDLSSSASTSTKKKKKKKKEIKEIKEVKEVKEAKETKGKKEITRASQACVQCRLLKVRCDETKPCKNCCENGTLCFEQDPAIMKKAADQAQAEIIDGLNTMRKTLIEFRQKMNSRMARLENIVAQSGSLTEVEIETSPPQLVTDATSQPAPSLTPDEIETSPPQLGTDATFQPAPSGLEPVETLDINQPIPLPVSFESHMCVNPGDLVLPVGANIPMDHDAFADPFAGMTWHKGTEQAQGVQDMLMPGFLPDVKDQPLALWPHDPISNPVGGKRQIHVSATQGRKRSLFAV